jgi:hypothetical protein
MEFSLVFTERLETKLSLREVTGKKCSKKCDEAYTEWNYDTNGGRHLVRIY